MPALAQQKPANDVDPPTLEAVGHTVEVFRKVSMERVRVARSAARTNIGQISHLSKASGELAG